MTNKFYYLELNNEVITVSSPLPEHLGKIFCVRAGVAGSTNLYIFSFITGTNTNYQNS